MAAARAFRPPWALADAFRVSTTHPRLSDPVPEYRTRLTELFVKWTYTPVVAFLIVLGAADTTIAKAPALAVGIAVIDGVMAAAALWAAWVRSPKLGINVDADGILLQTWFRTRHFAWSELRGFTVRLGRVYVVRANGRMCVAPGLGTTTFARSGRTFDVADELNSLLADSGAGGVPASAGR